MSQISIDFQDGKFLISCPFWANDLVTAMPSRNWSKARRVWVAPLIRKNAEYIANRLIKSGYATATDAVVAAIAGLEHKVAVARTGGGLPHWYKFKTEPMDCQRRAYNKLYGLHAMALHMDRGTGKSKTVIDIACALRMEGKIDAAMVICKLSLRRNWEGYDIGTEDGEREGFIGHAPIPVSCHLPDTSKVKDFERWLGKKHDFPILIVGTESLSAGRMINIAERFATAHSKLMIIMDESQDIMGHKATRSERIVELGQKYACVKATLTGTPTSTGPLNLFMQFEFLDPQIIGIGDFYAFRNQYAVMGGFVPKEGKMKGKPVQVIGYQNLDELATAIAPYVFEVQKSEVMDLPPKVYEKRYLTMTTEQRELYRQIKREEAYEWAGKETAVQNVLELELRLHQVVGGHIVTHREEWRRKKSTGEDVMRRVAEWHRIMPPAENPKVQEILDIAKEDKQQIIWCAYRQELDAVANVIRDAHPNELVREFHGGIGDDDREAFKREYQAGKAKFLVGNTATGGVGHTFTACEIMTFYNNTEKMIDRVQAEDRAHRRGLKHSVLYIDLVMEKTCDVLRLQSLQNKMDLAEFLRLRVREASDLLGDG